MSSTETDNSDKLNVKLHSDLNSVNSSETCVIPCCTPKQSLPENLCSSHLKTLDANDTDSASDSSKETCDVSITPTEERISSGSVESIMTPLVESLPVPIVTNDTDETAKTRDSGSGSLGYVSFKENIEPSTKVLVDQEQERTFQGLFSDTASSSSNAKNGKSSNPSINITVCDSQTVKELKRKQCCSCDSCPCYDNPLTACHFTKDLNFSASKIKECESVEEGYHSMEEPHSPGRGRMHLSEMLKQYENWHPEGLEEVPLPE